MADAPKEILVIDDEDDCRTALKGLLEGAGYVVHQAKNVGEALQMSERTHPNVVLVDLFLKKESGLDYVNRHSHNEALHSIPMIMVTGATDKLALLTAVSAGVADFVIKPYSAETILSKIRKALNEDLGLFKFSEQELKIRVKVTAEGRILAASTGGFLIESPVSLAERTQVRLSSELMEEMGSQNCIFLKTSVPAKKDPNGKYLCELISVAQGQDAIARFRRKVSEWR